MALKLIGFGFGLEMEILSFSLKSFGLDLGHEGGLVIKGSLSLEDSLAIKGYLSLVVPITWKPARDAEGL